MRRFILTAVACVAAAAFVPVAALAHGHGKQHGHHHRSHSHSRVHTVVFGAQTPMTGSTGTTGSTGSTASTGSTGSNGSTGPQITVASFTNGILTLTLTNGSPVSGAVTSATQIACPAAAPSDSQGDGSQGGDGGTWNNGGGDSVTLKIRHDGNQSSSDGNQSSSDSNQSSSDGGQGGGSDDDNGGGDDQGDGNPSSGSAPCSLVHGAVVVSAELRVTGTATEWEKIELAG